MSERTAGNYQVIEWGATNVAPRGPIERCLSNEIPPLGSLNSAHYSNPYFDERFEEGRRIADLAERDAVWRELDTIMLDDVPYIPIGCNYSLNYWWPWVKNFYGESCTTANCGSYIDAAIWIDQDLKAEMGY